MVSSTKTGMHSIVEGAPANYEVIWYPTTTMPANLLAYMHTNRGDIYMANGVIVGAHISIHYEGQDTFGYSTVMPVSCESSFSGRSWPPGCGRWSSGLIRQ